MNALSPYSIPILGLKTGVHHLKYAIDSTFFRHFEDSPVESADVRFEVQFDKRSDMILLNFELEGTVRSICDRCNAEIDLPLEDSRQLIVKYGDAEGEEEDEVVFISREASELNVAKYLYEFTILALPITNTYDCESDPTPPCNRDILKYLEQESDEPKSSSIWDTLKDFNNN